jgi:predicted DNA-binding transcriptional regulator YafY
MAKFAQASFGVFQEPPMNVVLRFSPKVSEDAKNFSFHASQKITTRRDGSVQVQFRAGGTHEICWHLFTWGDAVEIVKPQKLRAAYKALLSSALRIAR